MATLTPYDKCVELAKQIAIYRDMYCILCGTPYFPEGHHIWFKSRKIWIVQFDPDFIVRLCSEHHRKAPDSPHMDELASRDKILPRIAQKDPQRAEKIIRFLNAPHNSEEYRLSQEKPHYDEIAADLILRLQDTKEQYELDMVNCDEIFRGKP